MKKAICLALCLALMLPLLFAAGETGVMKPGQYQTSTYGHNGMLILQVTLGEQRIEEIKVLESQETPEIAQTAFDTLIPAIIQDQNIALDAVAGATATSNAILDGVKEAIKSAGGEEKAFMKAPVLDETPGQLIEKTADVVVIGSGAAGLSAAIEARKAGASVVVLEKLPRVGGNTYICGGYIYGTGSEYQKAKGFSDDTPQALADYWMERSEGTAWMDMLLFAAEESGATIDFLVANGVEFGEPMATGTSLVKRALRSPSGGVGFVMPLEKTARELGVEFLLNTRAEEILMEDGKVKGVRAVSGKDSLTLFAGAVVLATGGYDADPEALAKYSPDVAGQMSRSSPGNVGEGIAMAEKVGAGLVLKGGYIGTTAVPGVGYRDPINRRFANVLAVTGEGLRFVNEAVDYPLYHKAMTESGSGQFFQVFDAALNPDGLENALGVGVAFAGDSIEALAEAAGMPPEALAQSVAQYNKAAEAGVDEAFGKAADKILPIKTAPFYAVKIAPVTIGSIGGVQVNISANVMTPHGYAIDGFFAAGAVANGDFFYKTYPASGSSISMCFTFGRQAGMNAAAHAME